VVGHNFAWEARFRRLAHNYKWLAVALAELHYLTFAILMIANLVRTFS